MCACVWVCTHTCHIYQCVSKGQGNVLVCDQHRPIPSLTIQVNHRALILPCSSTNLDKHQNSPLHSVSLLTSLSLSANQMPGSVTLSEDTPTYSQCGPLLSLCVCARLKSSWFSCCLDASLPWWPWLTPHHTHTQIPVSKREHKCVCFACFTASSSYCVFVCFLRECYS